MNMSLFLIPIAQAAQTGAAGSEGFISSSGQWLAGAGNYYLLLAVLGTAIFGIQFVMSLFGGDMSHDGAADDIEMMEANDHEVASELNFFSLRSITGFLMFFGWAGFFWGSQGWAGLFIAIACGLLMMFMITMVIFMMLKLQHSGNIAPSDIINQAGAVYLSIPGGHDKFGKVTVKVQSRTLQFKAFADEELPTGTPIVVLEHIGGDCYKVARNIR